MYDAVPASEHANRVSASDTAGKASGAPVMQRARGIARVSYKCVDGITRLNDLYQAGCAKVRLPKVYDGVPTAVLINTAGGITGGDTLDYDITIPENAHAIAATQTAERAYRRSHGIGTISTQLTVGHEGKLEWLPQEAILFDKSALSRKTTIRLNGSAEVLAVESVVLGRTAMGEQVEELFFKDGWRVYRDDKLQFADDIKLEGDLTERLGGRATLNGKLAFATVLHSAPHAEDQLDRARGILAQGPIIQSAPDDIAFGASAWNGMLVTRFAAKDGRCLRQTLIHFLENYRSAPLPRVWHC